MVPHLLFRRGQFRGSLGMQENLNKAGTELRSRVKRLCPHWMCGEVESPLLRKLRREDVELSCFLLYGCDYFFLF